MYLEYINKATKMCIKEIEEYNKGVSVWVYFKVLDIIIDNYIYYIKDWEDSFKNGIVQKDVRDILKEIGVDVIEVDNSNIDKEQNKHTAIMYHPNYYIKFKGEVISDYQTYVEGVNQNERHSI